MIEDFWDCLWRGWFWFFDISWLIVCVHACEPAFTFGLCILDRWSIVLAMHAMNCY